MTSTTEIEAWLRERFTEAEITCGIVDRPAAVSIEPVILEEMYTYHLFRIHLPAAPRIQIGITALALERLNEPRLRAGLWRAIDSATRDTEIEGDERYIVTSADIVVRLPTKRVR